MYFHKVISKKIYKKLVFFASWRSMTKIAGSVFRIQIRIRIHLSEAWIRGSVSVSTTLVIRVPVWLNVAKFCEMLFNKIVGCGNPANIARCSFNKSAWKPASNFASNQCWMTLGSDLFLVLKHFSVLIRKLRVNVVPPFLHDFCFSVSGPWWWSRTTVLTLLPVWTFIHSNCLTVPRCICRT